jgi:hypothetical protein
MKNASDRIITTQPKTFSKILYHLDQTHLIWIIFQEYWIHTQKHSTTQITLSIFYLITLSVAQIIRIALNEILLVNNELERIAMG